MAQDATAVVVGRWTGTNRIQVKLEDGRYEVVESTASSADEVEPGDSVVVAFDPDGQPLEWRPAPA
ncbi:MAG TPA: hypothetical protein VHG69_11075 [Thermoleophilaceae bacterium]|nr:hypothetical protein [Thermoleophilaceae bacterium]